MTRNNSIIAAVSSACVLAVTSGSGSAAEFEYIKIVNAGDAQPGGYNIGTLFDFDLDGSQVVFRANGGPGSNRGIFTWANGAITPIATNLTQAPGGSGTFTDFGSPSISNGEVAFRGIFAPAGVQPVDGLYATRNGSLTRVADSATPVPNGTGNFSAFYFGSFQTGGAGDNLARGINSAFSNGASVFGGRSDSGTGLYMTGIDGITRRITDPTTPITGGFLGSIEGDSVGFVGREGTGVGVYRYSVSTQSIAQLVQAGYAFPNGATPVNIIAPAISGNSVAFNVETQTSAFNGIYLADSTGVHLVADGNTPVPGSNGTFLTGNTGLGYNGVTNSNGSVAFLGPRSVGGAGVYTSFGGGLSEVISTDDTLFGRPVGGFSNTPPKISGSNILFNVSFTGGGAGLYVAMGEHHWDAAGGGDWNAASNWSFDLMPRQVVPTFVDPANGGVILGPTSTTALKALTIGSGASGLAVLQMQSGQINVRGNVMITNRGQLDLAGVLSASGALDNSGIINGSGQIAAQLLNRETGSLRVPSGAHITITGQDGSNAGEVSVTGGELEFTGRFTNLPSTGIITGRDATLRFGQLTNVGSLSLVAGTSDVYGDIANTGTMAITGGAGGGTQTAIFHDDVLQNGTLTVSAVGATRSVAVFLGGYSGAGGITGGGDVFFEGDLRPGNSPASVTYSANISLASTTRVTMELGGRIQGAQYDHVAVTGGFTLGGNLDVVLIGGFSPQFGDRFNLFDYNPATLSGSFAAINLPTLGSGLRWDSSNLQTTGELVVIPEPTTGLLLGVTGIAFVATWRRRSARSVA